MPSVLLQLQPTPVSVHTQLVDVLVGWLGWLKLLLFLGALDTFYSAKFIAILNKKQIPKYWFENLERTLCPRFRLLKELASGL